MTDLTPEQIGVLTDSERFFYEHSDYQDDLTAMKILVSLAEARIENKRLREVIKKSRGYIQHTPECEKGKSSDHCTCGVMQFIPEMYPPPLESEAPCPECGENRLDDDRVKNGMKCGQCAYSESEAKDE